MSYITEGERIRASARIYLLKNYGSVKTGTIWFQNEQDAYNILITLTKMELEEQENTWVPVFETQDTIMYRKGFDPEMLNQYKEKQNVHRKTRATRNREK